MAKRSIPVLDIPRLAKDSLADTVFALRKHRFTAVPAVTYNKFRAQLQYAIERPPERIRSQVLQGFDKARNPIEARSNLECFLLTEELYSDIQSRCWVLPAKSVEDQTGLALRMPPAVVRYDKEKGYSAVVFPQPRKSFVPTEEELSVLGALISRVWIPTARDTLFAPYPDLQFLTEFVDLAAQRSGGPRIPRLRPLTDLPVVDEDVVTRRLANLSRALIEEAEDFDGERPGKR